MSSNNNKIISDIFKNHIMQVVDEINNLTPNGATPRQYVENLANVVVSMCMTIADQKLATKGTNHDEMMDVLQSMFFKEVAEQFKFQRDNKNQGLE